MVYAGKIVPVEITIALILNKMKACGDEGISKFLIDGFPRSEDNYDGWFAQAGTFSTHCSLSPIKLLPLSCHIARLLQFS